MELDSHKSIQVDSVLFATAQVGLVGQQLRPKLLSRGAVDRHVAHYLDFVDKAVVAPAESLVDYVNLEVSAELTYEYH